MRPSSEPLLIPVRLVFLVVKREARASQILLRMKKLEMQLVLLPFLSPFMGVLQR